MEIVLFVKLTETDQCFFIKIVTKNMLIIPTSQIIIIKSLLLNEKSWIHFKKINKNNQILSTFKKLGSNED